MTLQGRIGRLFVNDGRLRPFWRVLCFFAIGNAVSFVLDLVAVNLLPRFPVLNTLSIQRILVGEGFLFVQALIATWALGRYEGRRVDSYGLPAAAAFRGPFWEGAMLGLAAPALVGVGMLALHGWVIEGVGLHGASWLWAPLGWLAACVVVGVAEEGWYRGYMLQTLSASVGFWPATAILSLLFAADHYFYKEGENLYDVVTLVAFSVFICLSVRRTGTLWFAVGFHIAFDFMQLFVIGTRNGSMYPVGTFFASSFPGPAWVNGGVLGTEASVLVYPVTAALFLYLLWRYPRDRAPSTAAMP
jgi:CAAX protease family protein